MPLWTWKADPFAAGLLAATASLYLIGLHRLHRRHAVIPRTDVVLFVSGWLVLAVSLLSPLATISEWLFSVHMTQHELLMLVAAPLMAMGRPLVPMLWAAPAGIRRAAGSTAIASAARTVTSPLAATLIHALALWIWHLPSLYDAATLDDRIHLVQHLCFTATATLFWWGVLRGRYGRLGYGAAVFYVFATAVHSGGLGALLAFSTRAWYSLYAHRSAAVGHDAVVDQQLGGLIMWIPAGTLLMLIGLALFAAWLGEAERRREHGWS